MHILDQSEEPTASDVFDSQILVGDRLILDAVLSSLW
jgi:hypothetical protein